LVSACNPVWIDVDERYPLPTKGAEMTTAITSVCSQIRAPKGNNPSRTLPNFERALLTRRIRVVVEMAATSS